MKKVNLLFVFFFIFGLGSTFAQTSPNNAYGDNQIEVEPGVFAMYTGDVNQDDAIDGVDYSTLENDITLFLFGVYNPTDLNGDGNVDGADYSFIENQVTYFVFAQFP